MPSITAKVIRGKTYYYARECRRVNGKPRITWQKYLGRADDIINRILRPHTLETGAFKPKEAILVEFGAVVALYDLACRLHMVEIIDRHVTKGGHGPTVGIFLLIAAINRCVDPCSKAGIGQWFQATALRRLLPVEERQLSSQRYWMQPTSLHSSIPSTSDAPWPSEGKTRKAERPCASWGWPCS